MSRRAALGAALLVAPAASCNLVSGIDGFDFKDKPFTCPGAELGPVPEGIGICEARRIASLGTADRDLSPGAICADRQYHVYFQRTLTGVSDDLLCAVCDAQFGCGEETIIATGVINPYVRKSDPPEIWAANGSDIVHAPLNGCAPIPSFEIAYGDAGGTSETYPAISPGGTVLYFNRCEDDGTGFGCNMRIHVATRSQPDGPFEQEHVVQSLFLNPYIDDLRAQPFWNGESAETILFSSNRDGDWAAIAALDVFIGRLQPASPDSLDGFGAIQRIPDLSTENRADLAPWPLSDTQWLGSFDTMGEPDLYVIDLGCGP